MEQPHCYTTGTTNTKELPRLLQTASLQKGIFKNVSKNQKNEFGGFVLTCKNKKNIVSRVIVPKLCYGTPKEKFGPYKLHLSYASIKNWCNEIDKLYFNHPEKGRTIHLKPSETGRWVKVTTTSGYFSDDSSFEILSGESGELCKIRHPGQSMPVTETGRKPLMKFRERWTRTYPQMERGTECI